MTAAKKRKRETTEQRARRIGRGLGFYIVPAEPRVGGGRWWRMHRRDGASFDFLRTDMIVKTWRALAREMGIRL